jgi:membrane protein required for colicin V production
VVLGIFLAGRFHHLLAERLGFIQSESLARIIAFVLILIAAYVLVSILGAMLRRMLQIMFLGWVDHLGGGVFGFAVGWIICSVVVVLLARYVALPVQIPEVPVPEPWMEDLEGIRLVVATAISESKLAMAQIDFFPIILGLLPERFAVIRDFFGK